MRATKLLLAIAFLASASLWTAGCGDSVQTPKGDQATITGSAMNNGKSLPVDTNVLFSNADSAATAGGKVDSLGKFSLTPGDKTIGIPPGRYTVTFRPPDKVAPAVGTDDYKKMMMSGGPNTKPLESSDDSIPAKFQAVNTSTIKVEVKAGANNFDIDLAKVQ